MRGARGSLGGLALGAVIAATIAGYTALDRYGVRHAAAGPYLLLVMIGPALVYSAALGRRRVRGAVSPATVLVGVAAAGAYLLVLLALRLASAPAVAAVRETSVVIATALAAVVLWERVGPPRLAGAALVAAGVAPGLFLGARHRFKTVTNAPPRVSSEPAQQVEQPCR